MELLKTFIERKGIRFLDNTIQSVLNMFYVSLPPANKVSKDYVFAGVCPQWVSVKRDLCLRVSVQGGSLSRGSLSIQGESVFVQGSLYRVFSVQGVSVRGGVTVQGVFVQGGLCPIGSQSRGGLCQGGLCKGVLCKGCLHPEWGSLSRGSLSRGSLSRVSLSRMGAFV